MTTKNQPNTSVTILNRIIGFLIRVQAQIQNVKNLSEFYIEAQNHQIVPKGVDFFMSSESQRIIFWPAIAHLRFLVPRETLEWTKFRLFCALKIVAQNFENGSNLYCKRQIYSHAFRWYQIWQIFSIICLKQIQFSNLILLTTFWPLAFWWRDCFITTKMHCHISSS